MSFENNKEYTDQIFKKLNYGGKQFSRCEFDNCTFMGCIFTETVFNACKFQDCTFKECDLRLAQLSASSFKETKFDQSKLLGVNWTQTAWPKAGMFTPVEFVESDISQCTFVGLNLNKIQIVRCTATSADFAEADLTGANCTYTDFSEARFLKTNLTGADFSNATNYTITASLNTLKKTKFSLPEAIRLLYGLDIILEG
jgi:fluoroquinolone resistance protein